MYEFARVVWAGTNTMGCARQLCSMSSPAQPSLEGFMLTDLQISSGHFQYLKLSNLVHHMPILSNWKQVRALAQNGTKANIRHAESGYSEHCKR